MPWAYRNETSTLTCTLCGFSTGVESFQPGQGPPHDCQPTALRKQPFARPPCAHLGDVIRIEKCSTCAGTVKLKVFACAVHGACTIFRQLDGLPVCNGPSGVACGEYAERL